MQMLAMAGQFRGRADPLVTGDSTDSSRLNSWCRRIKALRSSRSPGRLRRRVVAASALRSRPSRVEIAQVPTLIFDEVDAGIGRARRRDRRQDAEQLGTKHQVMCVTHLPQVAASADSSGR